MTVGLASCTSTDNTAPMTQGGPGPVVNLNKDGGHADGPRDAAMQSSTGGHGGMAHPTGGAGGGVGGNAGSHATSGTGGGGGVVSGTGGAAGRGGAAGSGPQDDACTACEKARCSHPDLSHDQSPGFPYATLTAAYEVCFVGTGWPSSIVDPAIACRPSVSAAELGATAADGPAAGTAKTTLCQALLKCIHATACVGDANDLQCYCGEGVSFGACITPGFSPTGLCATQVAAALESTEFATSNAYYYDKCLANGAAFYLYDNCDSNCCEAECGIPPSGYEDPTFCNATATGGASGTGGTTGTGGVPSTGGTTGTGGVHSTGGTTGTGGMIGTGGVTAASGGTSGTGGVIATGGVIGTGGTPATGGVQGSGGTPGTGGVPGTGGSLASTGGSSGGSAGGLQNGTFNTTTSGWTSSAGAAVSWSTNDVGGSAQSGSLDLKVTGDPAIGLEVAAVQCISASAGASYNLAADILIPTGSSSYASLWFYGSTDCSGAALSVLASTPSFMTVTAWQEVFASGLAPAGAHSFAVHLQVQKSVGQSSAEALFDNVTVSAQ